MFKASVKSSRLVTYHFRDGLVSYVSIFKWPQIEVLVSVRVFLKRDFLNSFFKRFLSRIYESLSFDGGKKAVVIILRIIRLFNPCLLIGNLCQVLEQSRHFNN